MRILWRGGKENIPLIKVHVFSCFRELGGLIDSFI